MESLFDLWGKRDPEWEKKYQDTVLIPFTDYGKGVNQYQDVRGKIFGPGYEMFILAFFIGLYYDQTKPLAEDKAKRKRFGWPICEWGSREARLGRTKYSDLQRYMYAALIARTNIDFIALDKGGITPRKAVDMLMDKMEQYANFGFDFIEEKLEDNPNYFFKETAFLRVFLGFLNKEEKQEEPEDADDVPESLD